VVVKAVLPLLAVLGLALVGWFGAAFSGGEVLLGVVVPYGAAMVFVAGLTWRVLSWARSPVPFNITTTCGQQHSFPWIRSSRLGNPHTQWGVMGRLMLEVLSFRSLLRNVTHKWVDGAEGEAPRLIYRTSLGLWIGALVFHYALLVVLLRHARFFLDPVPAWLDAVEWLDSFLRIGTVPFFISALALLLGALFLLMRRLWIPWLRYLSLPADFFPLYLLLGIAMTGCLMRYSSRVDIQAVKQFCMGLPRLHPVAPAGVGTLFFVHITLVCVLFAYLPFSKLVHMASIPLSPTRNMVGAVRLAHHENPWNYPVAVHSYEEYENEYRGKMKAAGIPVEKDT
jgi:nitrate reductase gamma subunit